MVLHVKLLFVLALCLELFSNTASNSHIWEGNKEIPVQDTTKKPNVNIEEAWVDSMIILVIKDTAATSGDIKKVMGACYGELFTYINQAGLQPGKLMAFHYSWQSPFIMKIAVEVNRIPGRLTGRIRLDKNFGGQAVIAHYQGPYEKIGIAYNAIFNWLKEHQKEAKQLPFEVYLNDPVIIKDPHDLRTDVYQLIK